MLTRLQQLSSLCAYCAHVDDFNRFQRWTYGLTDNEYIHVELVLKRLGSSRLKRILARAESQPDFRTAALSHQDANLFEGEDHLGRIVRLYKETQPYEAQLRIAYEVFFTRFFDFLALQKHILLLHESDADVLLFVPAGQSFVLEEIWCAAIDEIFSVQNLRRSFIALMNSLKLTDRGFSALDLPIVNREQAQVLAAFNLTNLFSLQRGDQKRARDIAGIDALLRVENDPKKILQQQKSRSKVEDELRMRRERYGEFYKCWDSLRNDQPAHKSWATEVERLAKTNYTPLAGTQIAKAGAKIGKASAQIEILARQDKMQELPPLLHEGPINYVAQAAGDSHRTICYGCGKTIPKGAPSYQANTLIFASPSQRLQSGGSQTQPQVCITCAALSFVSPIKLGSERLILRLRDCKTPRYLVDDQLRMFALGDINLVAGRYALLKANEQISTKSVGDELGGEQYALYKVASYFPATVFERYQPEVIIGESEVKLLARHAALMRRLGDAFHLWRGRWNDKGEFAAFGRAIRHLQHERIPHAIYELLRAGFVNVAAQSRQLEELRQQQVRWLEMDKEQSKAQFYRDVAGMTGLYYAFCRGVDNAQKDPNQKRIEVNKIIQYVDEPYQFVYTYAGNTGWRRATLTRNNDLYFCYDEAKRLLNEAEVEVEESQTSEGRLTIQFHLDDIAKSHTWLLENRYKTAKELRELTYALKLSLSARFPEYLRKNRQETK